MLHFSGRRRPLAASGSLLALTLLLIPAPATQAKGPGGDPASLITKMENVYKGAKSYSATITTHQSGKTDKGQAFTVSRSRQLRFKAPNLFFDQEEYKGTGAAEKVAQRSRILVSDGKAFFVYSPPMNQYAKQNPPPSVSLMQFMGLYMLNTSQFSLSMGTPTKFNGRDVLVVMAKPKVPAKFPEKITEKDKAKIIARIKAARPTQVLIDKQNFQLLRLSGGSGPQSEEITLSAQSINGSLASNIFAYHPPATAKLYTPPAQPAGGGTPAPGTGSGGLIPGGR